MQIQLSHPARTIEIKGPKKAKDLLKELNLVVEAHFRACWLISGLNPTGMGAIDASRRGLKGKVQVGDYRPVRARR